MRIRGNCQVDKIISLKYLLLTISLKCDYLTQMKQLSLFTFIKKTFTIRQPHRPVSQPASKSRTQQKHKQRYKKEEYTSVQKNRPYWVKPVAAANLTDKDCSELKQLWIQIQQQFFPDRADLNQYVVRWSKRNQKRTLASCNTERLRIIVAKELNHPDHAQWLEPLLYHEMCHAVLGWDVSRKNGKYRWHGPEFKQLERAHPGIAELDRWIKIGGWQKAIRSHRAREAYAKRKNAA